MNSIKQEKDICPKCGKEFTCSKSGRCWCYAYELKSETMEKLAEKYGSCLCPECLKKEAE